MFFNETTTPGVILGGGLILIAVLMQASDQARRKAEPAPTGSSPA